MTLPVDKKNSLGQYLLSALTAILLILAFPPFNQWLWGWVALVPLLLAVDKKSGKQALQLGFFCGLFFFGGTLFWFIYMKTTAGIPFLLAAAAVVLLVIYMSSYFALSAWGIAFFSRARFSRFLKLLFIPSVWVALEFCRDRFLTGFGWLCLGHSQFPALPVIQIADVTGVFGVSYLLVFVNVCLKEFLQENFGPEENDSRRSLVWLLAGCLLTLVVVGYGFKRLNDFRPAQGGPGLKVAVVQGNIPQQEKWLPLYWPETLQKYVDLTGQAVSEMRPDLVIWPETSFPGFIWQAPERFAGLKNIVERMGVPLLFGVVTGGEEEFFNSALLISPDGGAEKKHDKMHLVPFGEYIPLRRQLPFLADLIPILDFSAGKTPTLFSVSAAHVTGEERPAINIGVLICFEDTVSTVVRKLVSSGADILVNITNDAWFLDERAPLMHLEAAAFQAVAFRRMLVRAANTGVSGLIDPVGHLKIVTDELGRPTFVEGYGLYEVRPFSVRSVYCRWGDFFVYLCLFALAAGVIFIKKYGA